MGNLAVNFGNFPLTPAAPGPFANMVGLGFLTTASVAHLVGLETLGWTLGLLVGALPLLAATTGFCVGCELYRVGARVRGIYGHRLDEIDLADVGAEKSGEVVVLFTHPLCTDCHELEGRLAEGDQPLVTVDVTERPDLARKYGIAVVPTAVEVAAGIVTARIAG